MQKVVITGSCSLEQEVSKWKASFEKHGYEVIAYPSPDDTGYNYPDNFRKLYTNFYAAIPKADIYFVMNEDKKGVEGYIGGGAGPELGFMIGQKIIHGQQVDIYVLKNPSDSVPLRDEVKIWKDCGWLKIWEEEPLFV